MKPLCIKPSVKEGRNRERINSNGFVNIDTYPATGNKENFKEKIRRRIKPVIKAGKEREKRQKHSTMEAKKGLLNLKSKNTKVHEIRAVKKREKRAKAKVGPILEAISEETGKPCKL